MPNARLLLVDDDRLILSTLGVGLRRAGYVVSEAASGPAAIARAEAEAFDLAVLDIRLPDMSGIQVARRLREINGIPALFLSAYSDQEMVEAAVAEGGVGYLVKPVDVPRLVPAIEAALARARDLKNLLEARGQMEQALSGGRDTSTAIGILMERKGLTRKTAFETLRSHARAQGRQMEVVAKTLVDAEEAINDVRGREKR